MISPASQGTKEVLLVEDNSGDVRLAHEALKEVKARVNLSVVGDGVEAMHFLRREGNYSDAVRPDLVLLDLNLPKKDGREVLAEIKTDPGLRSIPVIVFSVSTAEDDIRFAFDLQANCYIAKPNDLDQLVSIVKILEDFWLSFVKLPPVGKEGMNER
jgi:chemotaxis family two-component system response regulator Rcp1